MPIILIFFFQTVFGHFEDKAEEAWKWLLPNILPVLGLIITVFASEFHSNKENIRVVNKFYYRIALYSSLIYLLFILLIILFSPASNESFFVFVEDMSYLLAPLQGIVCATIGMFFVKIEQPPEDTEKT